jgi:tetratricopeptide (TPR) repeat protein
MIARRCRAPAGAGAGANAVLAVLAVVAVLTVLAGTRPARAQSAPTDARATALAHLGRQEIVAARTAIEGGLARRPNDPGLLEALGQLEWRVLRTASAIRAFERAATDARMAADASLGLGRIHAFRGWQAEGAFPGWHEEVDERPLAIAAYRRAISLRPAWAAPHVALGEAWLLDGQADQALGAFDAALALTPADAAAGRGRQRALVALGRPAGGTVPDAEADAIAAIDAATKASRPAEVIIQARAFIGRWPGSLRLVEVYGRLLSAYQGVTDAAAADVEAAIDARLALRPDPLGYSAAASVLIARRLRLERVPLLAAAGEAAGDRFITENRSSYKLEGKVLASRDRNRALFADLIGEAAMAQGDLTTADQKFEEAARLSNGNDFLVQFHRGALARARNDRDLARQRFYDALSLEAPPFLRPLRETAEAALVSIYAAEGMSAEETKSTLARELERRREERRLALVGSAIGKTLPALATTNVAGTPVDLLAERGNVTLLNFFAAW